MPIITLTTDLGAQGHYAAVLKGIIYRLCNHATIVDVSHTVRNFDVMEAAFVVRGMAFSFPEGTIHLVGVDPESAGNAPAVVMQLRGHYFVGPNNGLMSLIAEEADAVLVNIENEGLMCAEYPRSFRAARLFAPAAAFLASGGKLAEVGSKVDMSELRWGAPTYSNNALRGNIIHIDQFGNAVTNIQRAYFLEVRENRSFEIFLRNLRLKRIVTTYSDVGKADALAIFGEQQYLEIAMREASAAQLLGLNVHDMVTVEFSNPNID
ncbi:MAG: S-adenosyl-l-methionine hydroxide adenosyltransferase family protein [Bacteroidia bacterium]